MPHEFHSVGDCRRIGNFALGHAGKTGGLSAGSGGRVDGSKNYRLLTPKIRPRYVQPIVQRQRKFWFLSA
jgi:hypothetical protein